MTALIETKTIAGPAPGLSAGQAEELAALFRALADPTRIQIVSLLLAAGASGLCVCDIVAHFALRQPTISHHLKLLKDAGLASATKKGLWVYYMVNKERLAHFSISVPSSQRAIQRSECAEQYDSVLDVKGRPRSA